MMCVGEEGGGVSVCQEQNGAPLVCSGSQVSGRVGRVPLKLPFRISIVFTSHHISTNKNSSQQVSGLSSSWLRGASHEGQIHQVGLLDYYY